MKRLFMAICFIFMIAPISIYGAVTMIDKGAVGTSYTIQSTSGKLLLSRDGAEAKVIPNSTKITKPGTYYLTEWDRNNHQKFTRFVIHGPKDRSTYWIKESSDLLEAFKEILSQYKEKVTIKMEYGKYSAEQINQLFSVTLEQALATYPLLSYSGYELRIKGESQPFIEMTITYPTNVEKMKKYEQQALQTLENDIITILDPDLLDIQKEWLLYDYLIRRTTYSKQIVNNIAPPLTHTVQGTIVEKTGVCDGYAKTLMYMMNRVGIPTRLIVGTAYDSKGVIQDHAWNLINLEGNYYHVDATWGDLENNQIGIFYNYFNENDLYMRQTHRWNQKAYPKAQATKYNFVYMPVKLPGNYQVASINIWNQSVRHQVKSDRLKEGTLVLNQKEGAIWDSKTQTKLLNSLVSTLGSSIEYNIENKYDTIVINYRISY